MNSVRTIHGEQELAQEIVKLLRKQNANKIKIGDKTYNIKIADENIKIQEKLIKKQTWQLVLKEKTMTDNIYGNNEEYDDQQPPTMGLVQVHSQDPYQQQRNPFNREKKEDIIVYRHLLKQSTNRLHPNLRKYSMNQRPDLTVEIQENTQVHLCFLYASPIVFDFNGTKCDDFLEEISFKEEFNSILEGLKMENLNIKYKFQLATTHNLLSSLKQQMIGLHFAGHGLLNNTDTFRQFPAYQRSVAKDGDILVFEEEQSGMAKFLFQRDINKILVQCPLKVAFVVIATCHSQQIGMIFRKAGVPHVICIEQDKQLNDQAAIKFSRIFYQYVFSSEFNICQTFERAKAQVLLDFGENESNKYILLTQIGHVCDEEYSLYNKIKQGNLENVNQNDQLINIPHNVVPWIPRNKDTYEIIELIVKDKCSFVEVFGLPGIGKSSIIIKVASYLSDRNIFKNGIIYCNCSGIFTYHQMLNSLYQSLNQTQNSKINNQILRHNEQLVFNFLKANNDMLIILDNVEDIIRTQQLKDLLINLSTIGIRVLIGTNVYFDDLENLAIKSLKRLDKKKSRDLFISKILSKEDRQKLFSYKHIEQFHKWSIENISPEKMKNVKLCPMNCSVRAHVNKPETCILKYMEYHSMFDQISEPLTLCMAAKLFHYNSLIDIYERLSSNEILQKPQTDRLIKSLDAMIKSLQQFNKQSIKILYLINISISGLRLEDVEQILSIQAQDILTKLVDLNLISKDNDGIYIVQNFISKFITQQIQAENKMPKLLSKLYSYYLKILRDLKQRYSDFTIDESAFLSNFNYLSQQISNILSIYQQYFRKEQLEKKESGPILIDKEFLEIFDIYKGKFNQSLNNPLPRRGSFYRKFTKQVQNSPFIRSQFNNIQQDIMNTPGSDKMNLNQLRFRSKLLQVKDAQNGTSIKSGGVYVRDDSYQFLQSKQEDSQIQSWEKDAYQDALNKINQDINSNLEQSRENHQKLDSKLIDYDREVKSLFCQLLYEYLSVHLVVNSSDSKILLIDQFACNVDLVELKGFIDILKAFVYLKNEDYNNANQSLLSAQSYLTESRFGIAICYFAHCFIYLKISKSKEGIIVFEKYFKLAVDQFKQLRFEEGLQLCQDLLKFAKLKEKSQQKDNDHRTSNIEIDIDELLGNMTKKKSQQQERHFYHLIKSGNEDDCLNLLLNYPHLRSIKDKLQ